MGMSHLKEMPGIIFVVM